MSADDVHHLPLQKTAIEHMAELIAPLSEEKLSAFQSAEKAKYPGNRWWKIDQWMEKNFFPIVLLAFTAVGALFLVRIKAPLGIALFDAFWFVLMVIGMPMMLVSRLSRGPGEWRKIAFNGKRFLCNEQTLEKLRALSPGARFEVQMLSRTTDHKLLSRGTAIWLIVPRKDGTLIRRGVVAVGS